MWGSPLCVFPVDTLGRHHEGKLCALLCLHKADWVCSCPSPSQLIQNRTGVSYVTLTTGFFSITSALWNTRDQGPLSHIISVSNFKARHSTWLTLINVSPVDQCAVGRIPSRGAATASPAWAVCLCMSLSVAPPQAYTTNSSCPRLLCRAGLCIPWPDSANSCLTTLPTLPRTPKASCLLPCALGLGLPSSNIWKVKKGQKSGETCLPPGHTVTLWDAGHCCWSLSCRWAHTSITQSGSGAELTAGTGWNQFLQNPAFFFFQILYIYSIHLWVLDAFFVLI